MKFSALVLFLAVCGVNVFAQSTPVQGFVVDKESKQRLAKVYIYNPTTDDGIYNNAKGEFFTKAKIGDTLFAALQGYAMDTVVYKGQNTIVFQLKAISIRLKEINVYGKAPTPKEQYNKTLKEYKYALDRGSSKDLLNLGQGGVGLGIDAIYNLLSRQGKNARHLQTILERDYHETIIDYRFNPDYVRSIVGANDEELKDFILQYRPTYSFVLSASDYAFVLYIKNSYASYKRNPGAFRLPKLPKIEATNQ
ncbi:hypothetical protein [Pedobacter sp. UC225_65]|uniref:hypothetical protein n=1 Tax=Pedobacter sp. UC225_65 TaxID=3350173 RepID=UPI00366B481F